MLSEAIKRYLIEIYGLNDFDYDISDANAHSIFEGSNPPSTFEEFDKRARDLERAKKRIRELLEERL